MPHRSSRHPNQCRRRTAEPSTPRLARAAESTRTRQPRRRRLRLQAALLCTPITALHRAAPPIASRAKVSRQRRPARVRARARHVSCCSDLAAHAARGAARRVERRLRARGRSHRRCMKRSHQTGRARARIAHARPPAPAGMHRQRQRFTCLAQRRIATRVKRRWGMGAPRAHTRLMCPRRSCRARGLASWRILGVGVPSATPGTRQREEREHCAMPPLPSRIEERA